PWSSRYGRRNRYGPSPTVKVATPRDIRAFFMESESMPRSDYLSFPNRDTIDDTIADMQALAEQVLLKVDKTIEDQIPPPTAVLEDELPLHYDGLELTNGVTTVFMFSFPDMDIILPQVDIYGWTPDVMSSGVFDISSGNAVAWEDENLRVGLWLHSGWNQTAKMLQQYLELNDARYRREVWTMDEFLETNVIGSKVFIQQYDSFRNAKIVAAVRVPPEGVYAVASHVMDLATYLEETYPGHGFEKIIDRSDVLMIYFCGRQLTGEKAHPDLPTAQQSRFIIALVPEGS
ncbi:hypothetical protein LCGC14_1169800, partial [marine sediment metagenome]